MISIDFEADTVHGIYRDAIVLPDNHTLTEEQIEEMKSIRIANWISFIEEASKITEISEE